MNDAVRDEHVIPATTTADIDAAIADLTKSIDMLRAFLATLPEGGV